MSGYTPFEVDDIIYRTKQVIQTLKEQKEQKHKNQKLLNKWRFEFPNYSRSNRKERGKILGKQKNKPSRLKEPIQRGFDIAAKWRAENEI